ncbi:hypothetical protein CK203_064080 [Vitis vinifera]|uniref:Disease resistance R13L4/SHOC-2-like LRR domain-containing protein n=1 Tax=Vitis vinifera TaxID=29760 RepID=A0A438G456_VITVI|nr:hypothetical protein CK203_064080 [Vitis vinifera]
MWVEIPRRPLSQWLFKSRGFFRDHGGYGTIKRLFLRETGISELPSSIEHLRGLKSLELINCENLVALPNSIGNLTCLTSLHVRNCPKLHNLPDNLRSLQCCLRTRSRWLQSDGREIPSDLWCYPHWRRFVIPGSSGIPEWVSYQRMGVKNRAPMNWYEDNNFLGFVLFFHHVPLDDDECETTEGSLPHCELTISHGDQSELLEEIPFYSECKTYWIRDLLYGDHLDPYYSGSTSDPTIWVTYFPQINIPIPLPQQSRGSLGDTEDHPAKRLKIL